MAERGEIRGDDDRAQEQRARDAFGDRLDELRKQKGFKSHLALAKKADIDRTVLTKIINGVRRVNGDQIARLALALDVTQSELWSDHKNGSAEIPRASRNMSDQDRRLPIHENTDGGYTVKYNDSGWVASKLDSIQDDDLRGEAAEACSAAIRKTLRDARLPTKRHAK